jgi:hypothetical protein
MHPVVCHLRKIYKRDTQHNNFFKPKRTKYYYSINIRLFVQILMLHVSTFLDNVQAYMKE